MKILSLLFLATSLFPLSGYAYDGNSLLEFAKGIEGHYQNKLVGTISDSEEGKPDLQVNDCSDIYIGVGSPDSVNGGKIKSVNIDVVGISPEKRVGVGIGYYDDHAAGSIKGNVLEMSAHESTDVDLGNWLPSVYVQTSNDKVKLVKDERGNLKSITVRSTMTRRKSFSPFKFAVYTRTVKCSAK